MNQLQTKPSAAASPPSPSGRGPGRGRAVTHSPRRCLLALALLPLLAFSACTRAAEPAKLRVLTSFLPVYCFTANIAGDLAEVENLLPANVGPHDYQFAPRDLRKLTAAQLFDEVADPAEAKNLAADPAHAATVRELSALLGPIRAQK